MSTQFLWDQPVPDGWQADLARLCPGENVTSLALHWLAGLPEQPVQRWAIWEVVPAKQVALVLEEERTQIGEKASLTAGLWKALHGPDPRTLGHYHTAPDGRRSWRTRSLVSREQWDLHQATGGLPFRTWIIEGERGGHSWQFGPFEQHFLLALGATPDAVKQIGELWPTPGSQPYAPYDQRVFTALAERDLLRQWRESLSWDGRMHRTTAGLVTDFEARRRREEMMERTLRWMDNQIGEAVSDIPRSRLPQWSDFLTVQDAPPEDAVHLQAVHDGLDFTITRKTGG